MKLYPLNSASLRAVAALDEGIRRHIRERIGSKAEILFYGLRVVGWLPGNRVVIAAQARYAEVPGRARAAIVTEGFVVQLPDGTIERKLSSEELKNEYGFDGRIV